MIAAEPQPQMADDRRARRRLEITGAVQGVGFRPFVYRLARGLALAGWVRNGPAGVTIEVEGSLPALRTFEARLRRDPPAPARIDRLTARDVMSAGGGGFEILTSVVEGPPTTDWLPDLATCPDCQAEIRDPQNRRHRYPFTSCTACGPRDSIMLALPYDRAVTTMRSFEMCPRCRGEYEDPGDRRFHAQPNACPDCGPQLALLDADGGVLRRRDAALQEAAAVVHTGGVLALKGLGGFQLIADARNEAAVAELRRRKRRPHKPFAVMLSDLDAVAAVCIVSEAEADAMSGPSAPIVLLRRCGDAGLATSLAPGLAELGVMLPYTPLHHLLLDELGIPMVATSANLSGEPLETDATAAVTRLAGIADAFLVHDRPIARPLDDSVVRVIAERPTVLRAARGLAPVIVDLPQAAEAPAVAFGGHLKAAPAVLAGQRAVLGAHVGDLDSRRTRRAFADRVDQLRALTEGGAEVALHDRHPDYATTALARETGLPTRALQHHAVHLAACLADNGLSPPVLGIVWDGTGDGGDGTVWGGEVLQMDAGGRTARRAHLRPFRLPGGAAAVREPRRTALGLLYAEFGEAAFDAPEIVRGFTANERRLLRAALACGTAAPLTTSAGRLLDGLAWLLGLAEEQTWEGQAAAQLEAAAQTAGCRRPDDVPAVPSRGGDGAKELDWAPLLMWVRATRDPGVCAAGIHAALAGVIVTVAVDAGVSRVALTGGCFQNRVLTEAAVAGLSNAGIEAVRHRRVPPNDGGLALGQAAITAFSHRAKE